MRGNMIRRLRIIKGVSKEEVAEYIGMPVKTYADLEYERSGHDQMNTKYIVKFCEYYGITPNQYFGLEKITIEIDNVDGRIIIKKDS